MLIGRKSKTYIEPGYIFAPYMPISVTIFSKREERIRKISKILDIEVADTSIIPLSPKVNISSRYSTRMVNNKFTVS